MWTTKILGMYSCIGIANQVESQCIDTRSQASQRSIAGIAIISTVSPFEDIVMKYGWMSLLNDYIAYHNSLSIKCVCSVYQAIHYMDDVVYITHASEAQGLSKILRHNRLMLQ